MQGKPPPNQAATGPQSSPGMTPLPPQSMLPSDASAEAAGLRGIAPPPGADGKPKGRGGAGAQLSDVRWGMIFKLGWRLMSFFKVLVIGYAIITLSQNVVTLATSQLVGQVTNAIKGRSGGSSQPEEESTQAAQAPSSASTTSAEAAAAPEQKPPSKFEAWMKSFWPKDP